MPDAPTSTDDLVELARVSMVEVIEDLRAEHLALDAVLDTLEPADLNRATPAEGWAVRDQLAHLLEGDELACLAIVDPDGFAGKLVELLSDLDATLAQAAARAQAADLDQLRTEWGSARTRLLGALASCEVTGKIPWVVGLMGAGSFARSRIMETWAHGQDIVDAVSVPRPDTDRRLRHVAYLGVRTRDFSYTNRGLEPPDVPVRVELSSPEGATWSWGPDDAADRVHGPARDFALVVTQRRHHADTQLELTGDDAVGWMEIAQVFAGPPTDGRHAGTFPSAHGN